MKTFRVGKVMLVWGRKMELRDIERLADGKHHVHRNPGSRTKGKVVAGTGVGKCITCDNFTKIEVEVGTSIDGECSFKGEAVKIFDDCEMWRNDAKEDKDKGIVASQEEGVRGGMAESKQSDTGDAGEGEGETTEV